MAGIGFELQKLIQRDDLSGPARGYLYAAAVVAGPWILTVAAIVFITYWAAQAGAPAELPLFRTIVLYNFSISLALSAAFAMVTTRYLADRLYDGDESQTTGALSASILFSLAVQAPAPLILYFVIADIPAGLALIAVADYFAVAALWVAVVYLSTLKDYAPIVFAFVAGAGVSAAGASILAGFGAAGLLTGFTAGIALTLFMILGRTLGEFRAPVRRPIQFFRAFKAFPELAIGAFAYNVAIWIDKWIFWFDPTQKSEVGGLSVFPPYDGAMFLAHLTLVPGLAVFFALVETSFYERYRAFFWAVRNHGTLGEIENAQRELNLETRRGARTLLALHAAVAVGALLVAPLLANVIALSPAQLGIFRFGVIGTAAHGFFLYALILLGYFDMRRRMLVLSLTFLGLNALFTLISQQFGYQFYGAGYFLAALLSAAAAATVATYEFKRLRYLTFIGNNPATGRGL